MEKGNLSSQASGDIPLKISIQFRGTGDSYAYCKEHANIIRSHLQNLATENPSICLTTSRKNVDANIILSYSSRALDSHEDFFVKITKNGEVVFSQSETICTIGPREKSVENLRCIARSFYLGIKRIAERS